MTLKQMKLLYESKTKYLPELLKKLWEIEGRNKIHQPSRFEVIIDDPQVKLEGLVVHDPEEDLKRRFTMLSSV